MTWEPVGPDSKKQHGFGVGPECHGYTSSIVGQKELKIVQ